MADERTFIIVGASLAGAKAAETLREEGFAGRVVLIGAEAERPYERPPLSKDLLTGEFDPSKAYVHEATWYDEHSVELRLSTRVTAIDPAAHQITLDGGETLTYDKLLLATGSVVRPLKVPGADLDGVRYLRTLPESEALAKAITAESRVVVIGGGWIGLEVAAAARGRGASVALVEVAPLPLAGVLGSEVATIFAELHREKGVDLRVGVGVTEIRADGAAKVVVLDDGTELPADLVVVGVGVRPNIELAQAAGLAVDNGVLVNASLQTSDEDIYAAGDVAQHDHPTLNTQVHVEHWANAQAQGPAAARSMAGQAVSFDELPFFFSDQYDLGLEYAGFVGPDGYDEVVFRGDVAGREFIAFYLKDGRLIAGLNANVWDVSDQIQAIIKSGKPVDTARLADPDVPLDS
ncbi:MAG TPA: FAD-dependent oxidoreductase, partial [Mycobacteriales bacterium]|nr:FAD-dependent oxidoreductase [Mycobacteriales bacterium]